MKNNTNLPFNFTLSFKTSSCFWVLSVLYLSTIKTILGLFLALFKSETEKLPIIYANIRV